MMKSVARLLPLLLIYALLFAMTDLPEAPRSDGVRYLWFAENLSDGFYSPRDKINLWNGPGYPLVLTPVVGFGLPLTTARLLNIAFMFSAAVYFFLLLRRYVSLRLAAVSTYVLALWPPALKVMPRVMTEPLSLFLVCGFAFHLARMHRSEDRRWLHLVIASVYLGYLALTRVITRHPLASPSCFPQAMSSSCKDTGDSCVLTGTRKSSGLRTSAYIMN